MKTSKKLPIAFTAISLVASAQPGLVACGGIEPPHTAEAASAICGGDTGAVDTTLTIDNTQFFFIADEPANTPCNRFVVGLEGRTPQYVNAELLPNAAPSECTSLTLTATLYVEGENTEFQSTAWFYIAKSARAFWDTDGTCEAVVAFDQTDLTALAGKPAQAGAHLIPGTYRIASDAWATERTIVNGGIHYVTVYEPVEILAY